MNQNLSIKVLAIIFKKNINGKNWQKDKFMQSQDLVKVVQMVKTVPSWLLGEEIINLRLCIMCPNHVSELPVVK